MATSSKNNKPIDITKQGSLTWRQLQQENNNDYNSVDIVHSLGLKAAGEFDLPIYNYAYTGLEKSPLMRQRTPTGKSDYFGRSIWDKGEISEEQVSNLGDIRAENQPWYSKISNGVAKGVVLTGTTALETVGLLIGGVQAINEGKLSKLWDNPVTQALQAVNDWSEEAMPNYYTRDEMENPLSHIFSANFLGDKLLKNFGFMVGAYYGGLPLAWGIGKAGQFGVKSAQAAFEASRMATSAKVMEGAMTGIERMKILKQAKDRIQSIANTTRTTTKWAGSILSAVNEGAIEALNNSRDWERNATMLANEKHQKKLNDIDTLSVNASPLQIMQMKVDEMKRYKDELVAIQEGKAKMGNADLVMNLPVLLASNLFNLGKLYTRGFESNRRRLGSWFNGHRLAGSAEKGTLSTSMTKAKGVWSGASRGIVEGLEEYFQRAASESAGNTVSAFINRHLNDKNDKQAHEDVLDYIFGSVKNFLKASVVNLTNQSAIEEFIVGALSGALGMPVFGSQTKNAWASFGPIGIAGGAVGAYSDYVGRMEHEQSIADKLNKRVQEADFKTLYENIHAHIKKDGDMRDALILGNKKKFKDLHFEQMFDDINAFASAGHLDEFMEMIGYDEDLSDEDLAAIVDMTSPLITADEQRENDKQAVKELDAFLKIAESAAEDEMTDVLKKSIEDVRAQKEAAEKRLKADKDGTQKYVDKREGDFTTRDANGHMVGMNIVDPDGMRKLLEEKRKKLEDFVQSILQIRDEIDIETDGRLEDKDIVTLTKMRASINDKQMRVGDMALQVFDGFETVLDDFQKGNTTLEGTQEEWDDEYKKAKTVYENAKEAVAKAKSANASTDTLVELRTKEKQAKDAFISARNKKFVLDDGMALIDSILEKKDETLSESIGRIYAEDGNTSRLDRWKARAKAAVEHLRNKDNERTINVKELQSILASPKRRERLAAMVHWSNSLSDKQKDDLVAAMEDIGALTKEMIEYNEYLRKAMKDPTLLNETGKEELDKVTKKERDNKIEELALQIKSATDLDELEEIVGEAYRVNSTIVLEALEKAKQTASEELKAVIDDWIALNNFEKSVYTQTALYPEDVRQAILSAISLAHQAAIVGSNNNAVEIFKADLLDSAEKAKKADLALPAEVNELRRNAGNAIEEILKALEDAELSTATNSETRPLSDSDDDTGGVKKGKKEVKPRRKSRSTREKVEDTIDTLTDAIKNRIRNIIGNTNDEKSEVKAVASIDDLKDDKLAERIKAYQTKNNYEFNIKEIYQSILLEDEEIHNGDEGSGNSEEALGGSDMYHSELSGKMKDAFVGEFTSDAVSRFEYELAYKSPYVPKGALAALFKAIQQKLVDCGAYDFLDHNYLSYIHDKKPSIPIHLLRSTDDIFVSNQGNRATTFLAIEITDEVRNAIKKGAFGGNKFVDGSVFRAINIGEKQYQIVGVLSYNKYTGSDDNRKNVNESLVRAFEALQGAIDEKYERQVSQLNKEGRKLPAFIDSGYSVKIKSIFTGRLDHGDKVGDASNSQSLLDFVLGERKSADDDKLDKIPSRKRSDEWESGQPFYFGVVVNGSLRVGQDMQDQKIPYQPVNDKWMQSKDKSHNGAVFLFVRRADGKLYPLLVRKRTLKEFLKYSPLAKGKTEFDEELVGSLRSNGYFKKIISYLETMFDQNNTDEVRIEARRKLGQFLPFGKKLTKLFIDEDTITAKIKTSSSRDTIEQFDCNDPIITNVVKFLNFVSGCGIKFSLPSPHLDNTLGRDVISADVFEINARGFYNFNSSFTVTPIDKDGNPLKFVVNPIGGPTGGGPRTTSRTMNIGNGNVRYSIYPDGKVTRSDNKRVTDDEAKRVLLVDNAMKNGSQGIGFLVPLLGNLTGTIEDKIAKEFDDIVVIEDSDTKDVWVYDPRIQDSSNKLYRYSKGGKQYANLTEEGKGLYEELKTFFEKNKGKGFTIVLTEKSVGNGSNDDAGSGGTSANTYSVDLDDIDVDTAVDPLLKIIKKATDGSDASKDRAKNVLALLAAAEAQNCLGEKQKENRDIQNAIQKYIKAKLRKTADSAYKELSDKVMCPK